MIGKVVGLIIDLIILALALIMLGGACWGVFSIWKVVFALFV